MKIRTIIVTTVILILYCQFGNCSLNYSANITNMYNINIEVLFNTSDREAIKSGEFIKLNTRNSQISIIINSVTVECELADLENTILINRLGDINHNGTIIYINTPTFEERIFTTPRLTRQKNTLYYLLHESETDLDNN